LQNDPENVAEDLFDAILNSLSSCPWMELTDLGSGFLPLKQCRRYEALVCVANSPSPSTMTGAVKDGGVPGPRRCRLTRPGRRMSVLEEIWRGRSLEIQNELKATIKKAAAVKAL
jgi:hypothetical protein